MVHAEHDGDVLAAEPARGARRRDRAVPDGQRGWLLHVTHVPSRRVVNRAAGGAVHGYHRGGAGDVVHEQGDGAVHAVAAAEQRGEETGGGLPVLHALLPLRPAFRVLRVQKKLQRSAYVDS